jgi:hypothetical protein
LDSSGLMILRLQQRTNLKYGPGGEPKFMPRIFFSWRLYYIHLKYFDKIIAKNISQFYNKNYLHLKKGIFCSRL